MTLLSDLLVGVDLVVLEALEAGTFRVIGNAPDWLEQVLTPLPDARHRPEVLSYLEAFVERAEDFWNARSAGRLRSGPWTEVRHDETAFEASALCLKHRRLLLVERLDEGFSERQSLLQQARAAKLERAAQSRSEARAAQITRQVQAVFAGVPVILFALAGDGTFTLLEGQGLRALGLRAGEFVGRNMREVCLENPETIRQLERVLQGQPLTRLIELRGAVLQAWVAPMRQPDGAVDGAVGVAVNITDRIHAQEELEARYQELEAFIYTVSHDLRTPLVSIQGMAGLLEEAFNRQDTAEAQNLIGRISANVNRMERLLGDLLILSRVGRNPTPASSFDLGEVVQEALSDLEAQRDARHPNLGLPDAWPTLRLPRSEVYQVIINLLGNALKWARTPPRIRLAWAVNDQALTISVEDNGPGVPQGAREQIFQLFNRLEAHIEGNGVGLSIVRRICERHGGRVWVEDSALGGAAFKVLWPLDPGPSLEG